VILIATTVGIWDLLGCTLHRRIGLLSVRDKVLTSIALEHDLCVWVCTNIVAWLMLRPWSDPYSVALERDPPVSRRTSPSLQCMNRLVIGHGHCRAAIWSTCDDPIVGVGLLNDSVVMHYWPMLHQTNSGGDGRLLHQRQVVRRWWENNQRPLHLTVTELHTVFTTYLLIQLDLNNLLNTHHTDIIITHHSSCPQWRVLVIITMLDTNKTTVSTDELTQAVHI
jgi:hypothetical protein